MPAASLVQIAEADGFLPSLHLARRAALWAIKALRDGPMPLFAVVSSRESEIILEIDEPAVMLRPMRAGDEVVEDYVHWGYRCVPKARQDAAFAVEWEAMSHEEQDELLDLWRRTDQLIGTAAARFLSRSGYRKARPGET